MAMHDGGEERGIAFFILGLEESIFAAEYLEHLELVPHARVVRCGAIVVVLVVDVQGSILDQRGDGVDVTLLHCALEGLEFLVGPFPIECHLHGIRSTLEHPARHIRLQHFVVGVVVVGGGVGCGRCCCCCCCSSNHRTREWVVLCVAQVLQVRTLQQDNSPTHDQEAGGG